MTSQVTMTTVEIAALTGKRHDHVMRDARRMLETLGAPKSGESYWEATYQSAQKKTLPMLVLDKALTFTLITGYDTNLRNAVVNRWTELERAADPRYASKTVTDTLNNLTTQVDMMAPAFAEHVRRGTTGRGYTWDEACRHAEVPAKATKEWCRATGRFRRERPKVVSLETPSGPLMPAKEGFARGYFKRSTHTIKYGGHPDGFKVTLAGVKWLKGHRDAILAWDAERRKVRAVTDADGFVVDIKGEGAQGLTTADLRKEVTQ